MGDVSSLRNRSGQPRTSSKMIPSHIVPGTSRAVSTPKSRSITDMTVSIASSAARTSSSEPSPSRWRTREFKFYGLAFAVVVPLMIYVPMSLSFSSHPNYHRYTHKLSPGWLFGRLVDNSDPQYRTFRSNLPALLMMATAHLVCSTIHTRLFPSAAARSTFIVLFSTAMLVALHGVSAGKIFAILALNYSAAVASKPALVARAWPGILIIGNMSILFLNHRYEGYRLGALHTLFDPLDGLNGLLPRWHINFNITMLRIVSFALDYHWGDQSHEQQNPQEYRKRVTTSLPPDQYSFANFIAYCLYPPLYIAGPIITYNDFIWQIRNPLIIPRKEQFAYAARFVACLLTMELVLHTMYVVAIKDTKAWEGDGPGELSLIGFWNLAVVWLKLLIPWRFFRLWALLDNMDPPENMIRCVANNYSTMGFWRSWHRSYNLWVVRYIYIPLGGAKNVVVATTLVFTFVALWHDLSFKLLAWGWLISLFILPELICRRILSPEKYGHTPWYRHVCAIGGVVNILMMMSANLVGFVLGLDGTRHLITELTTTASGWTFTLFAVCCLFIHVQCMFEYREEEHRRGIDRKC